MPLTKCWINQHQPQNSTKSAKGYLYFKTWVYSSLLFYLLFGLATCQQPTTNTLVYQQPAVPSTSPAPYEPPKAEQPETPHPPSPPPGLVNCALLSPADTPYIRWLSATGAEVICSRGDLPPWSRSESLFSLREAPYHQATFGVLVTRNATTVKQTLAYYLSPKATLDSTPRTDGYKFLWSVIKTSNGSYTAKALKLVLTTVHEPTTFSAHIAPASNCPNSLETLCTSISGFNDHFSLFLATLEPYVSYLHGADTSFQQMGAAGIHPPLTMRALVYYLLEPSPTVTSETAFAACNLFITCNIDQQYSTYADQLTATLKTKIYLNLDNELLLPGLAYEFSEVNEIPAISTSVNLGFSSALKNTLTTKNTTDALELVVPFFRDSWQIQSQTLTNWSYVDQCANVARSSYRDCFPATPNPQIFSGADNTPTLVPPLPAKLYGYDPAKLLLQPLSDNAGYLEIPAKLTEILNNQ